VDWIAQYLSTLGDNPVLATTQPGQLFDSLPASAPDKGESFEAILRDFDQLVMPAVTQWYHPRFFAYFACTGSTPGILGEMLAAALNNTGLHWKASPAIAELEQRTLDWLREWLGLPAGNAAPGADQSSAGMEDSRGSHSGNTAAGADQSHVGTKDSSGSHSGKTAPGADQSHAGTKHSSGSPNNEAWFGITYDTASISSMHAIVAAREMVAPEARREGSRGDLVIYMSDQAHMSIEKGAIAVGIGQNNIRKVPSDSEFRMRPDELARMVQQDKAAGKRPFCVAATVGTTSSTSVDPVAQIVDVAEQHGLWVHVDAAYAGAAAILPEHRGILAGVERAHSLVVNPHKWLLTPSELSAFFTRRPDILRRAFSLTPEYLKTREDPRAHNFMDYGVPLGHRFRALKLWYVMRYFGRERVQQMLRSHIEWAQKLAALIQSDPERRFGVVAPVLFSVVCFRYRGSDEQNQAIMERVNHSGRVFISGTVLNGQQVIRLAIGNLATTWEDVEEAWELLKKATDEV
ncbi:MAG TPA: pyridoxal-dependent decarboxylase, partial [Candidatus Polarisedimenticolia bacterium]|nr:pyridoxal-dependent decarboxylase [Candidatus Polarisedimenticolia bacterium]